MRRGVSVVALALLAGPAGGAEFRNPVIGQATVTAYFDLGGTRDWNCGGHTYGGHRGTDIAIIGRFEAQDAGRDVVAGAAGRVVRTHDGEFDRCTTANCAGGGGFGNHVVVEHDDGKVTYYAHLRRGSVVVREGQQVGCGEKLGQVGSSGFSTGPHLHFEVRVGGNADDPFTGPCGGPLTYWIDQGAYRALPTSECRGGEPPPPPPPPPPPTKPDFHLAADLALPDRRCDFDDCADFARGGRSGGVPDAWVGDALRWSVVVHNRGDGATRGESPEDAAITLRYRVPDGLTPTRYLIETDHPASDRSSWQRNDAMDNPANPPEDAPPAEGTLRLNGYSAGEAKRVTVWLRAERPTVAEGPRHLRAWVNHVRGYYGEKESWDDAVEVNDGQTFNGGDLRVERRLDVYDPTHFAFDADDPGLLEGWRSCAPDAVAGLRVEGGALVVDVAGAAPCVESPPVRVPLAGWPGLRITLGDADTGAGRVAWQLDGEDDVDDGRAVDFDRAAPMVHLGPGWGGTLARLRVWPLGDDGAAGDTARLDDVRLDPEPPPPPPAPPAAAPDAGAPDGPDGPGGPPDPGLGAGGARPIPDDAGLAGAGGAVRPRGGDAGDVESGGADGVKAEGGCAAAPLSPGLPWAVVLLAGALRRRRFTASAARSRHPR